MRNGFFVSLVGLFLAAGLAAAQSVPPPPETPADGCDGPAPAIVLTPSDPAGAVWANADALLWWIKNSPTPALVSTGPPGSGAILNRGGTPLFGGSGVDNEDRFGGRFGLGAWLDGDRTVGVEGDYFFLASRTVDFTAGSNGGPGSPVIARPFFNVLSGAPDSERVAQPGLAGVVRVNLSSRLDGAELNGLFRPCPCDCGCECGCVRVQFLGGVRYLHLNEGLGVDENLAVLPTVPRIGGERFRVGDQFDTANSFYGGQVGARAEYRRNGWFVQANGKVALGDTHETADVNGRTTIIPVTGPATTAPGGLLALPGTNIGHYSHDSFAVVPELGLTAGYQPTDWLRVYAGYTLLYWSDVARPGNQIDVGVNPARLPINQPVGPPFGPARPSFSFHESDFWAQGIHAGMEIRY